MTENGLIKKIELEDLQVCPHNIRKQYPEEDTEELGKDLEEGQIEDIHVHWNPKDNKWHIMAGQRRWIGAGKKGLKTLLCRIHPEIKTENEAHVWCLKHEGKRRELSALDWHLETQKIAKIGNGDFKKGCEKLKISGSEYERLRKYRFAKLSPEAKKELFQLKKVTRDAVTKISKLPEDQQVKAVKQITTTINLKPQAHNPQGTLSPKIPILLEISQTAKIVLTKEAKKKLKNFEKFCQEILESKAKEVNK